MKQEQAARTLKQLQSQLDQLNAEIYASENEIRAMQKKQAARSQSRKLLKEKIEKFTTAGPPKMTEHALLRYVERVHGIDLKAAEAAMLNGKTLDLIERLDANDGEYPVDGGGAIVVKNNTIVTFVKK